jgi:hypothetical protein
MLFPLKGASGEEVQVIQDVRLQVYFQEPLRGAAQAVARAYPALKNELEEIFLWPLSGRPTVLLMGQRAHFQSMAESPLTVAFAVPDKGLIVMDHSRMRTDPFSLEDTLKHELCHLLLHQHIGDDRLPRWLDEGLCQWVSGGIPDIVLDQKRSRLNRAILSGRTIPMRALSAGFPRDAERLTLAYEQSKSFVLFLVGRFGREGIVRMLERMRQGLSVERALESSFSVSLVELERDWQRSLRKRMTWFVYVSYHLYEILFALMALISIAAAVKLVLRRRALREEMDDDVAVSREWRR